MQKGRLHVDAVMRTAIDDEGSHQIDDQRYARHANDGPALDRLRIGEPVDCLDQQVEADDEQGREVDERGDDFALRIAKGHQFIGGTPPDLAREPGQAKRGRIAEIVQGISDQRERARHDPADDLRYRKQDIDRYCED